MKLALWYSMLCCLVVGGVALETGHTGGRVVVKSKQSGQKLVIPYTATVLAGGLAYDSQVTRFRTDSPNIPPRTFQLTNNFRLPIAITNISLPKDALLYFQVSSFSVWFYRYAFFCYQ